MKMMGRETLEKRGMWAEGEVARGRGERGGGEEMGDGGKCFLFSAPGLCSL